MTAAKLVGMFITEASFSWTRRKSLIESDGMKLHCPSKKGTRSQFKKRLIARKKIESVTILNGGRIELFLSSLPAVEGLFEGVGSAALPPSYGSKHDVAE